MQYGPSFTDLHHLLHLLFLDNKRCLLQYETYNFVAITNCEDQKDHCLFEAPCTLFHKVTRDYITNGLLAKDYAEKGGLDLRMGPARLTVWQGILGRVLRSLFPSERL